MQYTSHLAGHCGGGETSNSVILAGGWDGRTDQLELVHSQPKYTKLAYPCTLRAHYRMLGT